ncbi:ureidoglycolate dehydrogenase [Thorsellia anophelis]|uniref:Ureidoglycolate dehydrogenase (NAD+) n=1 Tax=Thorsellia anophelis DSM 18579 TaxID=1123402 RepID=A0A1I0CLP4_9GAMM|nr:ureidoglycolate dehydrogenase [Thorsellia anophelis]SET20559.1 ureidoglycolate dehydrogenase (NAD+) [Thorsellia anophelis DSM 18579]
MRLTKAELHQLMSNKLNKAGLTREHADMVADVLTYSDARGLHSHGAMRVEYYAERINKGGTNCNPTFKFEETGPCTGVFDGDNAAGHVVANLAMDEAIKMAKKNGAAIIGIRRLGHSGDLSYYVRKAAESGLIGISMCQSDPMVVPYGGTERYYGTNPIGFGIPGKYGDHIVFDMGTTVGVWGRILHARSKNTEIPEGWAVDAEGRETTDPHKVHALLAIAGAKGYGLGMVIDILSGILVGQPHGKHVSSMYHDLTAGRELGQLHIVFDPARFGAFELFTQGIADTIKEINAMKPAPGFDQVMVPGQSSAKRVAAYEKDGIEIVDDIYEYLKSDIIHHNRYDNKSPFAN